ncbi:MAG: hypothetical protein HYT35_00195 [Candidatus Staskawiczbacteria bacterium]|nr:hypothetical protein [Candidatus Staskawiczbacteria bacterium]
MRNTLLKVDKKILIVVAIILLLVLIAGFFIYKYSRDVGNVLTFSAYFYTIGVLM